MLLRPPATTREVEITYWEPTNWENLAASSEMILHPLGEQIHTLYEVKFQTPKQSVGGLFVVSSNLKLIDGAGSGHNNVSLVAWPRLL